MKKIDFLVSFLAAICCAIIAAPARQAAAMITDAQAILSDSARIYDTCSSYLDSGIVTIVVHEKHGDVTSTKPFKTAFLRPDRFRFEFSDSNFKGEDGVGIVWVDGADVRTWHGFGSGVRTERSLGMAIAGATGVSGSSAYTIPALLLPDQIGEGRRLHLLDSERLYDADDRGVPCYRVRGSPMQAPLKVNADADFSIIESVSETVWIDRAILLIRRVDRTTRTDTYSSDETTIYEPCINVPVPAESLAFSPPRVSAKGEGR